MKNILFIGLGCACLSACAPTTIIKPVEVKIPVNTSCIKTVFPEPDWAIPKLAKTADATAKLKAALIDLYLSKIYIKELQAQLAACT